MGDKGTKLGQGVYYRTNGAFEMPHIITESGDECHLTNPELLALATVTKVWREVPEVQALAKRLHWALKWVDAPSRSSFDSEEDFDEAMAVWRGNYERAYEALIAIKEPTDAP